MVEKVSLSLDSNILAEARQIAGKRGLSALINEALRVKLQHERIARLLAEMDNEHGVVPQMELDRARKAWPVKKKSRSRRAA